MSLRIAFATSVLACALFCGVAASMVWPIIDGDGTAYFPPAIQWSVDKPFVNPLWLPPLNDSIDGLGGRRYIYHGFLYQIVIGTAARAVGGGARATVWAAYVLDWLAACVAALAIALNCRPRGLVGTALAVVSVPSLLQVSLAWHGRMEALVMLLVAASVIAWQRLASPLRESACGAATALCFFSSPTCGVLGCLILALALIGSHRSWRNVAAGGLSAALGAAVGGGIALIPYPFPLIDWLGGVWRHGQINLALPLGRGFVMTWLRSPDLPLLSLSFLLLIAAVAGRLVRVANRLEPSFRVAFICVLMIFGAGLLRTAVLKSEAAYNAVVWLPLLGSLVLVGDTSRWRTAVVVIALCGPAAGWMRAGAILEQRFEAGAITFDAASTRINQLIGQGCAITPGLWLAVDDLTKARFIDRTHLGSDRCVVVQQARTGQAVPPLLTGYRLVESEFRGGARVFGLPISRTLGGWEFAVYERTAAASGSHE